MTHVQNIYVFTKPNSVSLDFALGCLACHYKVVFNSGLCLFTEKALVYNYKTSVLAHNQQSYFLLDNVVRHPQLAMIFATSKSKRFPLS